VIEGKRVVLVDDSIVRGTTSTQDRADDARCRRARRCTCASPRRRPRIPDFYGIDTPELLSL
jgi:amidophosphoribosyltransferase